MIQSRVFSYCLGLFAGSFLPFVSLTLLAAVLTAAAFLFALPKYFRCQDFARVKPLIGLSFAFGLGLGWHLIWAITALANQLPIELEGDDIRIHGKVSSIPRSTLLGSQFEVNVNDSDAGFTGLISLSLYGPERLKTGEGLTAWVRLKRPHSNANPGTFDREAQSLRRGITATGYVREIIKRSSGNTLSVGSVRYLLHERLTQISRGSSYQGLLLALVLGEKGQIDSEHRDLFEKTGTSHLFVISGLHISLVAGLVYALSGALLKFVPRLLLRTPRQKIAGVCSLVAALLYCALAGFSLPTLRALIMLTVFIASSVLNRKVSLSMRFLIALACVLSADPLATTSPGFWFSFVAVASLIYFSSATFKVNTGIPLAEISTPFYSMARWIAPFVKSQFVVFIGLLLPLSVWGADVSLFAPLINLLAIPVAGLLITPACLCVALTSLISVNLATSLFQLIELFFDGLIISLTAVLGFTENNSVIINLQLAELPLGFGLFAYTCAASALIMLLLPFQRRIKALVLPLFCPLLFPVLVPPQSGFSVHVLDVGQGLAIIVSTANAHLLYDTGFGVSGGFSAGESVVVPFLQHRGVKKLNTIVISHHDADHSGGLEAVLNVLPVDKIISSDLKPLHVIQSAQELLECSGYPSWSWDGVTFEFLTPLKEYDSPNNQSCVLKISDHHHSVLIPGDIEREVELDLVTHFGSRLKAQLLIAPHHGSRSSSSYPFLKAVNPSVVAVSAGYRNRFQHPSPDISARYTEFGFEMPLTAIQGMLSFESADSIKDWPRTISYRESHPRYWR